MTNKLNQRQGSFDYYVETVSGDQAYVVVPNMEALAAVPHKHMRVVIVMNPYPTHTSGSCPAVYVSITGNWRRVVLKKPATTTPSNPPQTTNPITCLNGCQGAEDHACITAEIYRTITQPTSQVINLDGRSSTFVFRAAGSIQLHLWDTLVPPNDETSLVFNILIIVPEEGGLTQISFPPTWCSLAASDENPLVPPGYYVYRVISLNGTFFYYRMGEPQSAEAYALYTDGQNNLLVSSDDEFYI